MNDPITLVSGMTGDHRRDLEAHGGAVVSRYSGQCGRNMIIEDEMDEAREWAARIAKHRRRERGA